MANRLDKLLFSVVFATCKRDDILKKSLDGYKNLTFDHKNFEIVVIDNACLESTKKLIEQYSRDIPLKYLSEPTPGKNHALNSALNGLNGQWYIFTDDDVIPECNWLNAINEGIINNPKYRIFGGSIKPYIKNWPKWIDLTNPHMQSAFVIKHSSIPYEEISPKAVWGPNMIVHSDLFNNDFKFNTQIGPQGKNYIMGSETELLARLEKQGYSAIFLGQASVYHQIRPEQLSTQWIKGRAIRHGMGEGYKSPNALNAAQIFGMPRFEVIKTIKMWTKHFIFSLTHNKQQTLNSAYELNIQLGKLRFYRKIK